MNVITPENSNDKGILLLTSLRTHHNYREFQDVWWPFSVLHNKKLFITP